jgi:multidrug efflux pump subunit AcrB
MRVSDNTGACYRFAILRGSSTIVFGLAPLVFLAGEGTELYRGVGVIVMFGLLGTTLVSLTFLPALTVLILRISRPG